MENGASSLSLREAQFLQLVSMFQIAALQQMGKLPDPMTNEIEQDLDQAKGSIDFIEMIKEKTKGNLSGREKEFVDKVLFELHMNYVDEVDKKTREKQAEGREPEESAAETRSETSSGGPGSTEPGDGGEGPDSDAETEETKE